MKGYTTSRPGAYDSDPDEEFLVKHDAQIRAEAWKALPFALYSEDVYDLEVDDLAQTIRIKLWASRQKRAITCPKAYIRTISRTAAVDSVRRHKPSASLSGNTDEDPGPGDLLVAQGEGLQDPSYEIEADKIDPDLLTKLAKAILALPPRQRQAMLYALKDRKDDALPLINFLKAYMVDIEAMEWPEDKREVQLLRASLSIARKKLQSLLIEFMAA